MKPPITAAQAMAHPVVFETVNSLGQMADKLCAEVNALTKERDALTERVKALTPTLTPILCDKCGIETPDPWHSSEGANKHIHTCDACHAQQAENASCWNDNTTVEIKVLAQGDAVCGTEGYMLKRSTSVAAFYLDGWGATGRIYPEFTSSSVWDGTSTIDYPSITISDGSDNGSFSEIYFPEYKGWRVHSVSGGKTAAICLVKEN